MDPWVFGPRPAVLALLRGWSYGGDRGNGDGDPPFNMMANTGAKWMRMMVTRQTRMSMPSLSTLRQGRHSLPAQ